MSLKICTTRMPCRTLTFGKQNRSSPNSRPKPKVHHCQMARVIILSDVSSNVAYNGNGYQKVSQYQGNNEQHQVRLLPPNQQQ